MTSLLEPWVLLCVAASALSALLLLRASYTSLKVVRRFDARRATEGQLALERQLELASTFVGVAFALDVAALLLLVLAADKLSHAIRGAMCGYGVFQANEWGLRALFAGLGAVMILGWLHQLYGFDARSRNLDHARTLSIATLVVVPLVVAKAVLVALFLTKLDLTVVASCCSVTLDADAAQSGGFAHGPRVGATIVGSVGALGAAATAWFTSRHPTRARTALAGALAFLALPFALAAAVLEVAPHAFETPRHVCPFCLFRADAWGLGYPLFGALFLAVLTGGGAALSALLARGPRSTDAFAAFAAGRLRTGALAWMVALVVGILPVARYALVTGGASLFP